MEVNPHKHVMKVVGEDSHIRVSWCSKCGQVESYYLKVGVRETFQVGSVNPIVDNNC